MIRGGYRYLLLVVRSWTVEHPNPGNKPPFYLQATFDAESIVTPNPKVNQLSQGFPSTVFSAPDSPGAVRTRPAISTPIFSIGTWACSANWVDTVSSPYAGSRARTCHELRSINAGGPHSRPEQPDR